MKPEHDRNKKRGRYFKLSDETVERLDEMAAALYGDARQRRTLALEALIHGGVFSPDVREIVDALATRDGVPYPIAAERMILQSLATERARTSEQASEVMAAASRGSGSRRKPRKPSGLDN